MKIIVPGHVYKLFSLDNKRNQPDNDLVFVKRLGEMYPGNTGIPHYGTNCQEVIRVLINRLQYLDDQIPDIHNTTAIGLLRGVLYELEERAAIRHNRVLSFDYTAKDVDKIEEIPYCDICGHIECNKHGINK